MKRWLGIGFLAVVVIEVILSIIITLVLGISLDDVK